MHITYRLYVNVIGATQRTPLLTAVGGVLIPG
jgi:hypothetical protein